jgi:hypothetical protein
MNCPTCGTRELGTVGFESVDRATYAYCRVCEQGWWKRHPDNKPEGELVEVSQILKAAASIEPARRRSAAA